MANFAAAWLSVLQSRGGMLFGKRSCYDVLRICTTGCGLRLQLLPPPRPVWAHLAAKLQDCNLQLK